MKKIVSAICFIVLCAATYAQTVTGNLTIFSEDGHKFYLILNGQRQNNKAETNIRVENLTQAYYSAKVLFEDQTLGEISKNIMINGADNQPGDVTYKIKTGKDGKQVLRFYSAVPITTATPPVGPEGVPVYNPGTPTPVESTTTVTQVTTTQVNDVNTNVNINGMGVNMNVTMPANGTVVERTTTTTTTTTTNSVPEPVIQRTPAPALTSGCNGYPMAPGDYDAAKASIQQTGFDETKLSTAKEIAGANCLYAAQVAEICKLFGFEETKLDFAKYAYKRCIDPQNYFKVNTVFGFDSSKEELSKFTRGSR